MPAVVTQTLRRKYSGREPGEPARVAADRGSELVIRAPCALDGLSPAELLRGRGNMRDDLHVDARRGHAREPALAQVKQRVAHAGGPGLVAGGRQPRGKEVLFERDGTHALIVSGQAGCLSTDAW